MELPMDGVRTNLLAITVLMAAAAATAQNRYTLQVLGPIGNAVTTDPMDRISINAQGQAAGFVVDTTLSQYRAFSAQGGTITEIGTLDNDPAAKACAINDAGVIVGASGSANLSGGTTPFTRRRAFAYIDGTLDDLLGNDSAAYAVSNAGFIVGESNGNPAIFGGGRLGFLSAQVRTVGGRARGINRHGEIVGSARVLDGTRSLSRAFRWTNGRPGFDLGTLGGDTSAAEAINDAGQIVGWSAGERNENRAFLYENGTMRDLGTLGGESRAIAINTAGHVVGWSRVGSTPHAFLHEGGSMIDLAMIAPLRTGASAGMLTYNYATAINDRGQVAGIGTYIMAAGAPSELRAFVLTPVVTVFPSTATVNADDNLALQATSSLPGMTYQWRRNDTAIPGATGATLLVPKASASATGGNYVCHVTTAAAVYTSPPVPVRVVPAGDAPSRIVNLSIRANAGGDSDTLIVGFAIGGAGTVGNKPLLLRASGPALAQFGVPDAMANPALTVFQDSVAVASNDDWYDGVDSIASMISTARAVGAFPFALDFRSRDAAIHHPGMPPGPYTAHVTGTPAGTVLAEVYDAGNPPAAGGSTAPRLTNVSARTQVRTGDRILIAGFVLAGNGGRTLLIRGVGPGLSALSVSGVLADPKIELYQGPSLLASNHDWGGDVVLRATATAVGAFPIADGTSKDAALLVTLPSGAYTVQLASAEGGTGAAVVEIYEVR